MRVVLLANTTWNLYNFRLNLMKALLAAGHEVVAMAPRDATTPLLEAIGVKHMPWSMHSSRTSILRELGTLWRMTQQLRQISPDILLVYTAKGNIYGGVAGRIVGAKVINNITGLGWVFGDSTWLAPYVLRMYRLVLKWAYAVLFQNPEDKAFFLEKNIVPSEKVYQVPGSGIDVQKFNTSATRASGRPLTFLLIARLLWSKGVREYVEAARLVKESGVECVFNIVGQIDTQHPARVPESDLRAWAGEGLISFKGESDNVAEWIEQSDCIVLPSYREGLPRTLLEAAAMSRPIITTDTVGCREVVDDGVNGYLCALKDANDLAQKMLKMIRLTSSERQQMGAAGRAKIVAQFDDKFVIERCLSLIAQIEQAA